MVRTQIQLTEEQAKALHLLSSRLNVSQAELVRRCVDRLIGQEAAMPSADRRRRALAAAGRYASGRRDVSDRHDEHLAEAFKP